MARINRALLRVATEIHGRFAVVPAEFHTVDLPYQTWASTERLLRQTRTARDRGWRLASQRKGREAAVMLSRLLEQLGSINQLYRHDNRATPKTSIVDIYSDLLALSEEFSAMACDRQSKTLSVTTEPIELQEVYLGPFGVRLNWSEVGQAESPQYRVVALDPHPAATDDSITHPHVQDEIVCEGEGRSAIRRALAECRLFDFFTIVVNLLHTYGASSPYVPLSKWHGFSCTDCAAIVSDDDRWACTRCESVVCDQCGLCCSDCGDSFCNSCITECSGCREVSCHACLTHCECCCDHFCASCLESEERCLDCYENQKEEERETNFVNTCSAN